MSRNSPPTAPVATQGTGVASDGDNAATGSECIAEAIADAIAEADIAAGPANWSLIVRSCPLCGMRTCHGGGSIEAEPILGHRYCHVCDGSIRLVLSPSASRRLREQRV